ncbi:PREDICTED: uncharacterized protein LOC104594694 [Nelumbo nucifera]|uniref:Uncharacterized protein LOC104594694 n=1 Tax=Nelumbo nucifera TaxID=4432 RepID=A0A1U7ZWD8_NELNU|nr:PREDICTED: uncharacterized protein LOC104594694 [Nelumbo nucifera]
MSKLNLIGNLGRLNGLLRSTRSNQSFLPLFQREATRHFATDAEQKDSSLDPFLRPPSTGLAYGRLIGFGRNTLKTDIINFLEGCNLTPQDVKVEYNRAFTSVGMILQFPSRIAFDSAIRLMNRNGRLYKLERADRSQWDVAKSYDGKVVLMQGVPRNALPEDIERVLSGCVYNSSSIQTFVRPAFPDPVRLALVEFPSQVEAMNAVLVKNRSFCLNNQILMRVLQ